MSFYALGDKTPIVPQSGNWWVAPNAQIIGDVELKENASIWFGAVLRGDNEPIVIGENSNVQDNSILHTDPGSPLIIGKNCLIGHNVMLHGCLIGDGTLIGIGANVLDGSKIGKNCLIGAQSLIREKQEISDNSVVIGAPGKVVREISPELKTMIAAGVADYVQNWRRFKQDLRQIEVK